MHTHTCTCTHHFTPQSIYGFLFGMRARLAGSPSVLLEVATIKYRKSLIAGFLLGGLICIDVLCSMLYVIIGQPQALEPGYSGAYRDHCRLQEGAVGCLYALAATNIFVLSVTAITLWMYNGVGIRKVEHVKLRESVTKAFTACSSVFVLQTAFDQDRVLMFLVRSFMMIYVAFVSTSWIRNEYKQRQALFTFGRQNTEKNSLGKGKSEKGMRELSSVKAFNLLFRSPVVRGYLYHHCVKTVDTESVEFCSAVLEFKENPSVEGAEAILDTYVRDTSPHPINISGGEKRKLEERFQELKAEVQKAFAETKENPSDKEKPQHQLTTTHVVISPPINDPRLAKLRGVFNKTFKTVRTLVYINHWRAFGDSKYGITAGSILQWLGFIDGFCQEEQVWIYEHIRMGIESSINHERMRNNTDTKDASENQRRRFVRRGSHDGKGIITLNQISSSKKKMKPVAKSPGTEENWAVNRAGSSLVTNRQSTLFRARSSTYLHNESVSSAAHGRHASMTSNLSPINTYRGVDNAQSMVSECDSRARTPLVVSDRAETPKAEAGRRGGREARASRRNGPA
uniref:Uncharacterized protein n=1 Tax=Lotharella globosa TaxID=91324 RepID=A0A7S3Z0G9_9EUKA